MRFFRFFWLPSLLPGRSCVARLLLCGLMLLAGRARATHLVGGELELTHTTGASYILTLNLYFDAVNGTPDLILGNITTSIFDKASNSRMQDVVLRCLPSVVRARRQAASLTNIQTLLTLSDDANDRCRGGGVEDVWGACAERTEYGERLDALGMCYGKQGQAGYQMSWHRCGPGSIRPGG